MRILTAVPQQLQDANEPVLASPGKSTLTRSSTSSGGSFPGGVDAEALFLSYLSADGDLVNFDLRGKNHFTFGRNTANDVCINAPSCSRNHATLMIDENGQSWMENLSDTNVVKVNGSRISAPTKIFKGDIVEVGGVLISFGEQASSSSAILARRKIKTAISGVDNNAGVEYAQEVTPETEKEPGTLSPELDGYDTCSTTDQAASSSPDCVEEQQIMAIIGTASSPLGSKLLARKIRAQQQLKRQEEEGGEEEKEEKEEGGATEAAEGNTVGAASPVAVQDEEAVRTAGIIAHFGAATRLSNSPADSSYRIRMQYNRFAFSPSMGVTEEEHRDLLDAYVSQASSPIVQQRHFPSSTGLEETTFTSPAAARALLGQRAAYVVPSDAPASLDKTARRSYNQSVYSPSMFMTEAEVMSLRQLAAETRATETGIDEIRGIAEEEQETEFPLDFAA